MQALKMLRQLAAFYMSSLSQLRTHGKLTNHEASIAKVTPEDIQRVAKKCLLNIAFHGLR